MCSISLFKKLIKSSWNSASFFSSLDHLQYRASTICMPWWIFMLLWIFLIFYSLHFQCCEISLRVSLMLSFFPDITFSGTSFSLLSQALPSFILTSPSSLSSSDCISRVSLMVAVSTLLWPAMFSLIPFILDSNPDKLFAQWSKSSCHITPCNPKQK